MLANYLWSFSLHRNEDDMKKLILLAIFVLITLTFYVFCPVALAQTAPIIDTGKDGQGTTLTPDPNASAAGIRGAVGNKGYFQRYPYANLAFQDDLQAPSPVGPQMSLAGSLQQWMAYMPLVTLCDDGSGIAYMQVPMLASTVTKTARDSPTRKSR